MRLNAGESVVDCRAAGNLYAAPNGVLPEIVEVIALDAELKATGGKFSARRLRFRMVHLLANRTRRRGILLKCSMPVFVSRAGDARFPGGSRGHRASQLKARGQPGKTSRRSPAIARRSKGTAIWAG